MLNTLTNVRYSQSCSMTERTPLSTANSLFAQARKRARQGQFWSCLTGRSQGLLALKQVRVSCTIQAERDGGVRTVPINQIRGSEGRSHYFDLDFNPLYDQTKGRWLSIAVAQQRGKALPLVSLIQVGDLYFVQDGHHRISVARARGQKAIEARVIVWQVSGPLPWEMPVQAPHQATSIPAPGIAGIFQKLRREGSRILGHIVLGVQALGHRQGSPERRVHSVTGG
jgi:hypothetical protein